VATGVGVVLIIAASISWQRAQSAACASTASRFSRLSPLSAHAASVSASMQ